MTWIPERDEDSEKRAFIELYGEDLWNQIEAARRPKPIAEREVMKPRRPPSNDRPALQTEDSQDPEWWDP